MIAAVYGRTSKEVDDAYSVSSQIDAGQAYAQTNNLNIPDAYQFREDFTGRLIERPELTRIRQLVRERKIQALIIYATDRLTRRVSVGEIILDELFENGVQLHIIQWGTYVKNTPEDKLRFNFETTFSSFERDKFVERSARGKRKKASQGYLLGNNTPPLGYSYNGTKTNYVLNEYAPLIREIMLAYGIDHMRPARICDMLTAKGYLTPGVILYNTRAAEYKERFDQGLLTEEEYESRLAYAAKRKGTGEWFVEAIYHICRQHETYAGNYSFTVHGMPFTVPIPPIITPEEQEEVKKQLAVGKSRVARRIETRHEFLMARRLNCAHCKLSIQVTYNEKAYCYYRCWGRNVKAHRICKEKSVRREVVDAKAREFIRELLLNPRRLFAWWEEQQKQDAATVEEITEQLANVQRLLDDATKKYHRTLDRLTDNLDEDEVAYYTSQKEQLKLLMSEYRDEVNRLAEKRILGQVPEHIIQDFLEMGREYEETLNTSTDPTFWRGLVDDLDITGVIGRDGERQYIDFTVFGRTRKRYFLTTEPNSGEMEQGVIDFTARKNSS